MLVGHEKIFDRLKTLGLAGKLHHAQLFIGPEHVGKTKAALLLASLLQGAMDNVVLKKHIFEGRNSDTLLFLDDGEYLSIESIKKILERANQSHFLPYLIFVLENIGRMKVEAVNALLKTLEEPHENVLFFLTANQEEDAVPTLRSRSHITYFQTVSDELLREMCGENVYTEQLLFFAMGRPGKLRHLLEDKKYFEAHQEILQDLTLFLENPSTSKAFELGRKYETHSLLGEMLDLLLRRMHSFLRSRELPSALAHLDCTRVVERIESSKQGLKNNLNHKLLLDNLLLPFVA